jgi:aromatic ring-opening dioxygenase catalytic subunit (LigB family)
MRFPTLFVSHGGGPWPWIEDMRAHFGRTAEWMRGVPSQLPGKPRAIVSVSGHWEAERFTVSAAARPPMVYDYYGFPPHTYQIRYAAPGAPELARRVRGLLQAAGLPEGEDAERGFDHGTFVPLALMFPDADVPVLSVSMRSSLDPAEHLALGAALAPLRDEGVFIMGSGLSYHNLRLFGPAGGAASREFEAWLTETVTQADAAKCGERLLAWRAAPSARVAHPREDHLVPLMVNAGAAGAERGRLAFSDDVWGVRMTSYWFG